MTTTRSMCMPYLNNKLTNQFVLTINWLPTYLIAFFCYANTAICYISSHLSFINDDDVPNKKRKKNRCERWKVNNFRIYFCFVFIQRRFICSYIIIRNFYQKIVRDLNWISCLVVISPSSFRELQITAHNITKKNYQIIFNKLFHTRNIR